MRYDEITVGQKESLKAIVTSDVVNSFAKLSGDDNKLHVNEEFARTTVFKERVAHGMLSMSFISALIGTKLPGDGALWFSHSFEFLNPVRIGDTLRVFGEVVKKFDADNVIEIKIDVLNQNDSLVTRGHCKVKVLEITEIINLESPPRSSKKVLVVLGANGGLGSAFLTQSKERFDLVISVARGDLKSAAVPHNHEHIQGDVLKELISICFEIMRRIKREFGQSLLEVSIVNCITESIPGVDFWSLDEDLLNTHLTTNVNLNFLMVQHFTSTVDSANVNFNFLLISSMYSKTNPKGFSYYSIAKSGLESLVAHVAKEIGPKGHRINCISPSVLETKQTFNMPIRQKQAIMVNTPMRRLCTVEDVVELGFFLCSTKASFITGQNIHLNGGML